MTISTLVPEGLGPHRDAWLNQRVAAGSLRAERRNGARLRFAVVVVNYRTPDLVIDCVESFLPWLDPQQDRIVVVDNDSGDDSVVKIREQLASSKAADLVELIAADRNGGFSYGNNRGIEALNADYYWLTNSDTLCRPDAPRRLAEAIAEDDSIGLLAPQLEWPDGQRQTSCFRYASPLGELVHSAAAGPLTRTLSRFEVPIHEADRATAPDWVSFASVVVRREVFERIGPMDEGYFMYFEDIDLCRRAREAGWRIAYLPEARVVHLRGGSSPVKTLTKQRKPRPHYYYASRSRYLSKFYGRKGLWAANGLWWAGRPISLVREALRLKQPHICHREWRDIWTNGLDPMGGRQR